MDRAGDGTRNFPGSQTAGRVGGESDGDRDPESAAEMARHLLENHRCHCDVTAKKGSPGGRGGRDVSRDGRGRWEQEDLLMPGEPREEGDLTSAGRGRTNSGQAGDRDDSSAESGETMNETLPYHVHIVERCPNGDPVVTFVPEPKANGRGHFIGLPVVVSKYWGPAVQYRAEKPGRCVAKAIVSLGTLLLVAVICFLAGYFTVDFANEESTTAYRKGPVRVQVESSLRQHYVTSYDDRNSQIYRDFSSNFTEAIDSVFLVSALQGQYSHCTMDSLRRGSVVVEYTIQLHGPPTPRLAEEGPSGDVESRTRQAVLGILKGAATSGQLASLNLDSGSIKVTRVVFGLHQGSTLVPSTLWPEWATVLKTEPGLVNQRGCGTRPGDERPLASRIVGGSDSQTGRWPWLGSMQYRLGDELDHRCSASLLNPEWAITAAHCVDGGVGDILVDIIFGDHDLEGTSPSRQRVEVERIVVHPGFTFSLHENDLALLKLKERVRFDENVLPACVETEPLETQRYTECYIAGWGHTEESGNISRILQEAEVPLVSKSQCSQQFHDQLSETFSVITENMICAARASGGVDSCQSDSGGSLTCRGDDGSWRVVGLTSFGYGCGRPEYSGVYTRVSRYWDFISSAVRGEPTVTCQELTIPTCLHRLPYTKVFSNSQADLALFLTLIPNPWGPGPQPINASLSPATAVPSPYRGLVETLVCLAAFPSCEDGGREPSVVPCREFCQDALGFTLAMLARCEKYPTGATSDAVYCRKGINADCGPAHLHPTTSNHSVIMSPYLPGVYNEPAVGCTWRVTGPPCTAVVFRFTQLKFPSTGRGKIITIGSGNDTKNRSSALYKLFGPAVPSPLIVQSSQAWLSFSSVSDLFQDLPENFYFMVEVHAVDIREQGLPEDVCLTGLGDCTENELCYPAWWRCDGITDCSDGVDETNCTTTTTHHGLTTSTTEAPTTVP